METRLVIPSLGSTACLTGAVLLLCIWFVEVHNRILTPISCDPQMNLGLPCPQRVVQLPDIAWEQYTSGLCDFEREFCDKKRKTRRLKLIFDKGMFTLYLFLSHSVLRFFCYLNNNTNSAHFISSGLPDRPKSPVEPKKEGESSTMYSSLPTSDAPENGRQAQVWLYLLTKIIDTTHCCCCHRSYDCFLVCH